jgi:hypothetical protein
MSKTKNRWINALAWGCLLAISLPAYTQPCPMANPILGANQVCPGTQTQYTMSFDNSPTSTYEWELFGSGGQIIGPTNGISITIQWQNINGGPFLLRCTERVGACSFENDLQITVADDLARRPFNCFSELSIPFDEYCEKLILPEHLLTAGAPECANSFVVELSIDGNIPVPNPVGIEYLGQIITARVIHTASGQSCVSRVLLKDGSAPRIYCENDTTLCNDPLAWEPFHPGFKRPLAEDNCSGQVYVEPHGYEWVQLFDHPLFDAYIVRSWKAVDKYNNESKCEDTIFLRRVIFDQILCPPDTLIVCDRGNLAMDDSLYFSPADPVTSGVPTFDGYDLWTPRSYCDFSIKYEDRYSYKCQGTYTIHRYWYLSQITPMAIFEDTCHQIIEIVDTVGPVASFDTTKVKWRYHDDVYGLPSNQAYKTIYFPTLDHECLANGYFPAPVVTDNCTNVDSVQVNLIWDNGHISYVNGSPGSEHLKFKDLTLGKHIVVIKLRDACHNTSYDTLIAVAEDRKAPYLVVDKYPVVTLSGSGEITWIDASVFDEGTWDNCGISLLLARRVDWWKHRVDLCDSLTPHCYDEHDTIYCANLEGNKHLSEVEAHYYETMQWLKEDFEECGALLYNAWKYDLCRKGTLECRYYSTPPDKDYFRDLMAEVYDCQDIFEGSVQPKDLDLWDQIGGGWSQSVPFDCDDVCGGGKVTVELLAIDAHCNISRIWVDVLVEDKSAPEIQHFLPDLDISCWAYNHFYRDSVVAGNFNVFGKYGPFPKDQYSSESRKTIIYDRLCPEEYHHGYEYDDYIISDTILNGVVFENCELLIEESQKLHFERCGEGWIERTFIFKGACNSPEAGYAKAIQRINIYNDCPLQEHDIIWPTKDTTIYACSYINIKTDGPRLRYEDECREIGIHYKDKIADVLYNADSTCLKVIRTWAIIDWCRQNEPYHEDWIGNQNYHYYEFDQIIYFRNTSGPEIFDCDIDTICIGANCTGNLITSISVSDDCTPSQEIKVSWVLYENTQYGYLPRDRGDSTLAQVSDLAMGDYKLVWKAEDGCHNLTFCTDHFTVKDCVVPTPVCLSSTTVRLLPIDLNQDGQIDTAVGEIWARELNVSSYDNCLQDIDFRIRIKGTGSIDHAGNLLPPDSTATQIGLGCNDIGSQEVEMWVIDQSGNADYCIVSVEVIAPVEGCNGEPGKVRGTVSSMLGAGIGGVEMLLENVTDTVQVVTTTKGQYDFGSFAMDGSDYRLWPEKTDDPIAGISTLDVIRIAKHLLSKDPLKSTFQLRAADTNGDGNISVLDVINLRKLILGKIDQLPNPQPWQFFNKDMAPASTLNLTYDYSPWLHFTGVKVGDVNGDVTNYTKTSRAVPEMLTLTFEDGQFETGREYVVAIRSQQPFNAEGLQMELSMDQDFLDFRGIEPADLDLDEENWHSRDGRIYLSWVAPDDLHTTSDTLFYLKFVARDHILLSESLALTSRRIQNEIYVNNDTVIPFRLIATEPSIITPDLSQNAPNPFRATTTLDLKVPRDADINIRISDLQGRIYLKEDRHYSEGIHQIEVTREQLGGPGIYLFELFTGKQHEIRKLILLE